MNANRREQVQQARAMLRGVLKLVESVGIAEAAAWKRCPERAATTLAGLQANVTMLRSVWKGVRIIDGALKHVLEPTRSNAPAIEHEPVAEPEPVETVSRKRAVAIQQRKRTQRIVKARRQRKAA